MPKAHESSLKHQLIGLRQTRETKKPSFGYRTLLRGLGLPLLEASACSSHPYCRIRSSSGRPAPGRFSEALKTMAPSTPGWMTLVLFALFPLCGVSALTAAELGSTHPGRDLEVWHPFCSPPCVLMLWGLWHTRRNGFATYQFRRSFS